MSILSVKLFVLGQVFERDTHGYEIKERAKQWGVERWANIGFGSIYHAISKLEEEEMILEQSVEQEAGRPPRFVYRITPKGSEAFLSLLRETLRTAPVEKRDIDLALAFIHFLPPAERVSHLEERLLLVERDRDRLRENTNSFAEAESGDPTASEYHRELNQVAPWIYHGVRHSLGRAEYEVEWTKEMISIVAGWGYGKKS